MHNSAAALPDRRLIYFASMIAQQQKYVPLRYMKNFKSWSLLTASSDFLVKSSSLRV
jgi:hypothetical protein